MKFSARFTPAMLSAERDRSTAKDAPGSAQSWPDDPTKKLGVDICLLPRSSDEDGDGDVEVNPTIPETVTVEGAESVWVNAAVRSGDIDNSTNGDMGDAGVVDGGLVA